MRAAAPTMALKETLSAFPTHLRTVCEFSLGPPMRAKVDRQSFDELKPGVDKALAVLDWFEQLQLHLAALVEALGHRKPSPGDDELQQLAQAVDCCVVMENQFSGWSALVNRFSWFKRTFGMLRKEIASEIDVDKLNKDITRFQNLIGAPIESFIAAAAPADQVPECPMQVTRSSRLAPT